MGARLWGAAALIAMLSSAAVGTLLANFSALSLDHVARQDRGARQNYHMEAFLPTERWANTADPTARVFNGRVFVYVAWDHAHACGPRWARPRKRQGSQGFCMIGYRAYSTDDPSLRGRWISHGSIMMEESVPWVFRGGRGWRAAARMWAPCVVRGDNGKFYLFFPAPATWNRMAIGVAESWNPEGPFIPRRRPLNTPFAIDPSVVKLHNGRWAMFTSSRRGVWVQMLDNGFRNARGRGWVSGLDRGYKEGPFAFRRNGKLMLQYARHRRGEGYTIRQAVAYNRDNPFKGFRNLGVAIGKIDTETNHGSVVQFNSRSFAFYHRHMERPGGRWKFRRAVFREVTFDRNGRQNSIYPPATKK